MCSKLGHVLSDIITDWRELDGVKPRWENQVSVLDELLANVKNFNFSHEAGGMSSWFYKKNQLNKI